MKARTWLVCVTASTAAAVALIGGFSFISVSKLIESHQTATSSRDVIETLEQLLYRVADAGAAERAYLITGKDGFLDAYRATTAELNDCLKDLRGLIQNNPEQLSRYNRLLTLIRERISSFDVTLEMYQRKGMEAAFDRVRQEDGMAFRRDSRELIDEMKKEQTRLFEERMSAVNKKAESSRDTVLYGTIFAILFILLMNILLRQRIIDCVDKLLKASANIEHGRYDTVVLIDTDDEFEELAEAYNILGQKLQHFSDQQGQDKQEIERLKQASLESQKLIDELANKIREISWLAKEEILDSLNIQDTETALVESIEKISESRAGIERKSHTAAEFAQRLRNGSDAVSSTCADMSLRVNLAFDKSEQSANNSKALFHLSDDIHELIASFDGLANTLERLSNSDLTNPQQANDALSKMRELAEDARSNKLRSDKVLSHLSNAANHARLSSEEVRSQVLSLKLSAEQLAELTKRFPEMQSKLQAAVAEISATSRLHGSLLMAGREHVEALLKLAERASTQIKRISLKSAESEQLGSEKREFVKPS